MAKILPEDNILPEILEGTSSSFTFSYDIDATEELDSISITSDFPDYILTNGPTFSGTFIDLFELEPASLKYRQNLDYGEAQKFSQLPPKGTADLYSYTPPHEMKKTFNVTVSMDYHLIAEPDTKLNITKHYIQVVQGNWDTFLRQFLEYVK